MAVEIIAGEPSRKKRAPWIEILAAIGILGLVGFGVWFFMRGMDDYSQKRDMELKWTEMAELAVTEDPNGADKYIELAPGDMDMAQGTVVGGLKPAMKQDDYLYRSINLKALQAVNPDVSGYIYSPDTRIDYPILQEQEPEKYFYLDHDIHREYDRYGSIFEICDEERAGMPGPNAVDMLFGHNMASGAMFAGITNYRYGGFDKHPIYIYREDYRIEYMPFAVCVIDAHDGLYDFDAYSLGSDTYKALLDWIREANTVAFSTEIPDPDTPMLVLSTCNDATSDIRITVFFRETRRALVPEYYETLEEVEEYGGDRDGILKEDDEEDRTWFDDYWDSVGGRPSASGGGAVIEDQGGRGGSGGASGSQGFIIGGR